jgi:SM-20-related protein
MSGLDLAAFRAAPLVRKPFEHLILPRFVTKATRDAIQTDFPQIDSAGSFPIDGLSFGPKFRGLLEELTGPAVRAAFEEKFGIDLHGRPTMLTVRGRCGTRDGNIHTDSHNKIITVLVYLNSSWEGSGGCLRLLRSATDLDDVIAEVPPTDGTLLAFRRSDNSFHGHKPFTGVRRVIQLNWITERRIERFENLRHRASARVKRMTALLRRLTVGVGDRG